MVYVAGVVKVGVVDVDISISSHLKEELTLATGKQLQVISTIIIIFKSFILLRSQRIKPFLNLKQYVCVAAMWLLVTYSNCFEIVCTVAFSSLRT